MVVLLFIKLFIILIRITTYYKAYIFICSYLNEILEDVVVWEDVGQKKEEKILRLLVFVAKRPDEHITKKIRKAGVGGKAKKDGYSSSIWSLIAK